MDLIQKIILNNHNELFIIMKEPKMLNDQKLMLKH